MKKWIFDKEHSQLFFEAKHLMIANVIGQIEDFDVTVNLKNEAFDKADFKMSAQTNSLSTRDKIRDDHLKNEDFLDVQHFPELSFKSTTLKEDKAGNHKLIGLLTLRGITKEVALNIDIGGRVVDSYSGDIKSGYSISGQIDRRDFGINFSLPMIGGGLAVSHIIKVRAELEFTLIENDLS